MSDANYGLAALVFAVLAIIISIVYGSRKPAIAVVTPSPSKKQLASEERAKDLAAKALAAKEEALKLAGTERDIAMSEYQKMLHAGAAELVDDTDALNAYMKQVGEDIRGR